MADLALTKKSETSTKITFTYAKVAGCEGYQYYAGGVKVSRTLNPDDLEVTFGKVASGTYRVVPLDLTERADGYVWPANTDAKPTNTAKPTISGTAKVGQTLTCNPGTWTGNPTFKYQWYYENSDGSGDVAINVGGIGTTQSYTPVAEDTGGRNYCVVTATNSAGSATAQSDPTAVVQPANLTVYPADTLYPSEAI